MEPHLGPGETPESVEARANAILKRIMGTPLTEADLAALPFKEDTPRSSDG